MKIAQLVEAIKNPETLALQRFPVAGEEGFEPSAYGFGDRVFKVLLTIAPQ